MTQPNKNPDTEIDEIIVRCFETAQWLGTGAEHPSGKCNPDYKPDNPIDRAQAVKAIDHLANKRALEAKLEGMKLAKSRVLRRTEIPKDAKEPTRDIVVVIGEECARIIDLDIQELEALVGEEK